MLHGFGLCNRETMYLSCSSMPCIFLLLQTIEQIVRHNAKLLKQGGQAIPDYLQPYLGPADGVAQPADAGAEPVVAAEPVAVQEAHEEMEIVPMTEGGLEVDDVGDGMSPCSAMEWQEGEEGEMQTVDEQRTEEEPETGGAGDGNNACQEGVSEASMQKVLDYLHTNELPTDTVVCFSRVCVMQPLSCCCYFGCCFRLRGGACVNASELTVACMVRQEELPLFVSGMVMQCLGRDEDTQQMQGTDEVCALPFPVHALLFFYCWMPAACHWLLLAWFVFFWLSVLQGRLRRCLTKCVAGTAGFAARDHSPAELSGGANVCQGECESTGFQEPALT